MATYFLTLHNTYACKWHDAFRMRGWITEDEVANSIINNRADISRGELIYQDERYICLAGTTSGNKEYDGVMCIPRNTIDEIIELKEDFKRED